MERTKFKLVILHLDEARLMQATPEHQASKSNRQITAHLQQEIGYLLYASVLCQQLILLSGGRHHLLNHVPQATRLLGTVTQSRWMPVHPCHQLHLLVQTNLSCDLTGLIYRKHSQCLYI